MTIQRVVAIILVIVPILVTDATASAGPALGLRLETGAARSGGGISDISPLFGVALDWRVSKHISWRIHGHVVEFEEEESRVEERSVQFNLTYHFPGAKYFMKGPYVTAGYGWYKLKSHGPVAIDNEDESAGGFNFGGGYVVPLVEEEYLSFYAEALYTAMSKVNPANVMTLSAGIQWGF